VYESQQQIIEPVRTVPNYRQATSTANRQALLANVNYKNRGDQENEDKPAVGTRRSYSRINDDGSFTFGYEVGQKLFYRYLSCGIIEDL